MPGLPVTVFAEVLAEVGFTPARAELVAAAQAAGWTVALVSGGFEEVVSSLASRLGITRFRANRLEVADGVLTGRTVGPVIDRAAKAEALREFAAELGVPLSDVVAIGDGANDLDMMDAAGLGIAFNAKPMVRAQADASIEGTPRGRAAAAWPLAELPGATAERASRRPFPVAAARASSSAESSSRSTAPSA